MKRFILLAVSAFLLCSCANKSLTRYETLAPVLEKEGFLPEETLFIDDGERNIATAAALGLKTLCPRANSDWTVPIEEYL